MTMSWTTRTRIISYGAFNQMFSLVLTISHDYSLIDIPNLKLHILEASSIDSMSPVLCWQMEGVYNLFASPLKSVTITVPTFTV